MNTTDDIFEALKQQYLPLVFTNDDSIYGKLNHRDVDGVLIFPKLFDDRKLNTIKDSFHVYYAYNKLTVTSTSNILLLKTFVDYLKTTKLYNKIKKEIMFFKVNDDGLITTYDVFDIDDIICNYDLVKDELGLIK